MKIPTCSRRLLFCLALALVASRCPDVAADTYYLDAGSGSDDRDGRSPEAAWKTLDKASAAGYRSGDRLLLKKGCVFPGSLRITQAAGTESAPVVVDAYGEGLLPVIDASATGPGVFLDRSNFIEVNRLEITSDGGKAGPQQKGARSSGSAHTASKPAYAGVRCGVALNAEPRETVRHTVLRGLYIHDVFNAGPGGGTGISVGARGNVWHADDVLIEQCRIERTGHKAVDMYGASNVRILDNRLKDIGGPGIQPSATRNLVIRGNIVDASGAKVDPRQYGRGSCSWVIGCTDVLVEKNVFMNAWGINDSCGFHIDMNNKNVVAQYNLSAGNAGGFVEILGKNQNCAYRYNISINDGWRVKGSDRDLRPVPKEIQRAVRDKTSGGAQNWGYVLWTSGYNGKNPPNVPDGPFNSYIYNNTIYVKADIAANFNFASTTDGLLVANNIFQILGKTQDVHGFQESMRKEPKGARIKNVVFKNNLYNRARLLPEAMNVHDSAPVIGEAGFARPGGTRAEDYAPRNVAQVKDKGIAIEKLPGDPVGLTIGLAVEKDFFGNPIRGLPDLGAVEAP